MTPGTPIEYEWGPWIEHDYTTPDATNPRDGLFLHIVLLSGREQFGWSNVLREQDVIGGDYVKRYRIRQPLVSEWLQSLEVQEEDA